MADALFRHADPLDPADPSWRLRRQWAVLKSGDEGPPGWSSLDLNDRLYLTHHPETPITHISTGNSGCVLVGTVVEPLGNGADIPGMLEAADIDTHHGRVALLHGLAGIYVLIWHTRERVRIYTDPGALMATYYGQGRAVSTPSLLPGLQRDSELDSEYRFNTVDDWYPGDLTPYVGVKALLANHVLDVQTGESSRFWPTEPPPTIDRAAGVEAATEILRRMARSYLDSGPCLFSLTGGQDSRVSLAAVRPWIDEVEFFTIRGPGIKKCDIEYAQRLAIDFDLNHRFVDNEESPPWLTEAHTEISAGMQPHGATSVLGACRYLASPNYIHVSGALGAITKSMFWPNRHPRTVKVSALAREFLSDAPLLRSALARWMDSLAPDLPAPLVYNLMYLEQRGGRWQSVSELGSNLFYRPATLFASRELFEVVNGLPVRDQYGGRLLYDFTRALWPELLSVPYCRPTAKFNTYLPKRLRVAVKRALGKRT